METAFEVLLKSEEKALSKLYGDLKGHRLMYKDICVYDGIFHDNPLAEISDDIPLFPNLHKYTQEQWSAILATMYAHYADCIPRRSKRLNFVPGDQFTNSGFSDFHHRRVSLDMFIVFGYHAGLFSWNNPNHFMLRICDNCVVYRDWMV